MRYIFVVQIDGWSIIDNASNSPMLQSVICIPFNDSKEFIPISNGPRFKTGRESLKSVRFVQESSDIIAKVPTPLLVLHGSGDTVTTHTGSEKMMESISKSQSPRTLAFAVDGREDVMEPTLQWMERHIDALKVFLLSNNDRHQPNDDETALCALQSQWKQKHSALQRITNQIDQYFMTRKGVHNSRSFATNENLHICMHFVNLHTKD